MCDSNELRVDEDSRRILEVDLEYGDKVLLYVEPHEVWLSIVTDAQRAIGDEGRLLFLLSAGDLQKLKQLFNQF